MLSLTCTRAYQQNTVNLSKCLKQLFPVNNLPIAWRQYWVEVEVKPVMWWPGWTYTKHKVTILSVHLWIWLDLVNLAMFEVDIWKQTQSKSRHWNKILSNIRVNMFFFHICEKGKNNILKKTNPLQTNSTSRTYPEIKLSKHKIYKSCKMCPRINSSEFKVIKILIKIFQW